jgi:hypothetical protein
LAEVKMLVATKSEYGASTQIPPMGSPVATEVTVPVRVPRVGEPVSAAEAGVERPGSDDPLPSSTVPTALIARTAAAARAIAQDLDLEPIPHPRCRHHPWFSPKYGSAGSGPGSHMDEPSPNGNGNGLRSARGAPNRQDPRL